MALSNTYAGCKICLWYDSIHWYGLGINNSQIIYNFQFFAKHIFQANSSSIVSIYSSGLSIGSNLLSSTV